MFTGIVEEVGRVRSVEELETGRRLAIDAGALLEGARPGDSIAIDGVCTTVVSLYPGGFLVEAIGTTLSRTTLGGLLPGGRVNLEVYSPEVKLAAGGSLTLEQRWEVGK